MITKTHIKIYSSVVAVSLVLTVLSFLIFLAFPASPASAATNPSNAISQNYTLLAPLPCLPGTGNGSCNASSTPLSQINLDDFISYAYKFMLALAVLLAVFMITVGGFQYMFSEAIGEKNAGLDKVKGAAGGLLLALCAYIVLYTIDPQLVKINANIPSVCGTIVNGKSTDSTANCNVNNNLSSQDLTNQFIASLNQQASQAGTLDQTTQQKIADDGQEADDEIDAGDALWGSADCDSHTDQSGDLLEDAPDDCYQAQADYDEATDNEVDAVSSAQKDIDQNASAIAQQNLQNAQVLPCQTVNRGSQPANTVNPNAGVVGCYQGYGLDQNTNQILFNQLNVIEKESTSASSQMGSISNGSQSMSTTELNAAKAQILAEAQTTLMQKVQAFKTGSHGAGGTF